LSWLPSALVDHPTGADGPLQIPAAQGMGNCAPLAAAVLANIRATALRTAKDCVGRDFCALASITAVPRQNP
jgi:hypothetical protein